MACGWIDAVPVAGRPALRQRLAVALTHDPRSAFLALGVVDLDRECIVEAGPGSPCSYHHVLGQLALAAAGRFAPADILDELDEDLHVARVSFCLGDQSFHCEVPLRDDVVQPGVIDLVNRALAECGEPARFFLLPGDWAIGALAFVPPAVFDRARTAALIPPHDVRADRPAAAPGRRR